MFYQKAPTQKGRSQIQLGTYKFSCVIFSLFATIPEYQFQLCRLLLDRRSNRENRPELGSSNPFRAKFFSLSDGWHLFRLLSCRPQSVGRRNSTRFYILQLLTDWLPYIYVKYLYLCNEKWPTF